LRLATEARLPEKVATTWGLLGGTWLLGDAPAPEAVARLRELLDASTGDRLGELELTWRLGVFLMRAGDLDEGRDLIGGAEGSIEELGAASISRNLRWWMATWVDPWLLDAAAWEADLWSRFGDPLDPACEDPAVAVSLAAALCEQGGFEEAQRLTSATAHLSAHGEVMEKVIWNGARARALARLGEPEEADRLSSVAVAMTDDTDRLDMQGEAAWHRADVLRALGRHDEADGALRVGIAAFDRKGFGPSADKLRGLLGST
jgi:hypothetical protein